MKFFWVQLALFLFQADVAVKQEVEVQKAFDEEQRFLDRRIRLKRFHNYGAAGGRLQGHMPELIKVSGTLTLGSAAAFAWLIFQKGRTVEKAGLSLLMGGALSNLYDRCTRGYVVDYVSFRTPFERLSRLVFNLADFFIIAGTFLIFLGQAGRARR